MPCNPYLITEPALISFSCGAVRRICSDTSSTLSVGRLPADVIPCFANTGKEDPKTLDFVHQSSQRWSIPIVRLEFEPTGEKQHRLRVVDHATAARVGQPFEAVIRERQYLPNPVHSEVLHLRC